MSRSRTTFKPGRSGNPNGRPKGSKNKFSKAFKEEIKRAVGRHMKNIDKDLTKMSPSDRVKAIVAISKFVMAEKKEVKGEVSGQVKVTVNYSKKQIEDEDSNNA